MKRILVLLLPIIILNGCQTKRSFTIKGIIKEKTKDYIYLNRVNVNTLVFVDSAKVRKSGLLVLKSKQLNPIFTRWAFLNPTLLRYLPNLVKK